MLHRSGVILGLGCLTACAVAGIVFQVVSRSSQSDPIVQKSTDLASTSQTSSNSKLSDVKDVPLGEFRYGGSTSWAPIRGQTETTPDTFDKNKPHCQRIKPLNAQDSPITTAPVDPVIQEVRSQFKFTYCSPSEASGDTPGSSTGIRMLITGELDFAQSSRPLNDKDKESAAKNNIKLKEIAVAMDALAIVVNPELPIQSLTFDQIKDIYAGKITNWNEVGGPDLMITPYSRRQEDGGTVESFLSQLKLEYFGIEVQFAKDTTDGLKKVNSDRGGIYYASATEIVPQCSVKPLSIKKDAASEAVAPYTPPMIRSKDCPRYRNKLDIQAFQQHRYPLVRNLFVIVNEDGQDKQKAGEAYANLLLTTEGQALLEKVGFVSIR